MENKKNYYDILGVKKDASPDEIKSAYRKLVKQYHPDLHPDDKDCAAKFKEINEANEVLSDPQKRKQYDFELENPFAASGGFTSATGDPFSGFGDIFSDIFGFGRSTEQNMTYKRKGRDINKEIEISFLDAALGCKKELSYTRKDKCPDCNGTGAKNGQKLNKCQKCGGTGKVSIATGNGFFRTVTARDCPDCGGSGVVITEACLTCHGSGLKMNTVSITFDIPAGADSGNYIKRKGYGDKAERGGEYGDLLVYIRVGSHRIFKRKDLNLYVTVPITLKTACLGGKVLVPGLLRPNELNLPEGTQSGKIFTLKGKGICGFGKRGDLYVTINVETPVKLTRAQREALDALFANTEKKQMPNLYDYNEKMSKEYGMDIDPNN